MHDVLVAIVALVVGVGLGYGYRGVISKEKDALGKDVTDTIKKL